MFRPMLVTAACAMLLSAMPVEAQTRGNATPPAPEKPAPASPAATPPAPAPAARAEFPLQNVRVEITITDQRGTTPVKKTVSVVAADGLLNRVRFTSQFTQP